MLMTHKMPYNLFQSKVIRAVESCDNSSAQSHAFPFFNLAYRFQPVRTQEIEHEKHTDPAKITLHYG